MNENLKKEIMKCAKKTLCTALGVFIGGSLLLAVYTGKKHKRYTKYRDRNAKSEISTANEDNAGVVATKRARSQ